MSVLPVTTRQHSLLLVDVAEIVADGFNTEGNFSATSTSIRLDQSEGKNTNGHPIECPLLL
jgi:hypothetical protein